MGLSEEPFPGMADANTGALLTTYRQKGDSGDWSLLAMEGWYVDKKKGSMENMTKVI